MRAHHEDCDQRAGGEARGGMPWLVLASTGRLIIEETLRLVLVRRENHRPHRVVPRSRGVENETTAASQTLEWKKRP